VLTTYSKYTSTCPITVSYDDKIPPQGGFHSGVATITPDSTCGPGDCISVEFLNAAHNPAGVCRFKFSNTCANAG
jgi:hypothetical protein